MPAAATDFHVAGPVTISWGAWSGGLAPVTFTELGKTDNEDLVRITVRDHYRTFTRNDLGDMIAESVTAGSTASIDMTLVSWNQSQLLTLLKKVRLGDASSPTAANEGNYATVGGATVTAGARLIGLKITPTTAGETIYTFPSVMLSAGPEYIDFGNTLKRIALSFTSVPTTANIFATTTEVSSPS